MTSEERIMTGQSNVLVFGAIVAGFCKLLFLHCKNFGVWIAHKIRIETLCSTVHGIKDNNEGTKINTQCTLSFAIRCFTVGEALSDLNFNKTTSKKE